MRQSLRIIGGQWRRRQINFPALTGLRPTPDRVRETLFNWLEPIIAGADCLDLFAGSGALGFEALSRGARHVVMVDQSPRVIHHLRQTSQLFMTSAITLQQATVPNTLDLAEQAFDIIFLDPPFGQGLLPCAITYLQQKRCLKATSYIYFEQEKTTSIKLPWPIIKQGHTSQIIYGLTRPALIDSMP